MQDLETLPSASPAIERRQPVVAKLAKIGTIKVPDAPPYHKGTDAFDQSHNMSGLFCPADDWGVMLTDEKSGFHRLKIDRSGARPKVSYDMALTMKMPSQKFMDAHGLKKRDLTELDMEAVAATRDKVIFVGSHANKRNSGNFNAGSHLVAIVDVADLKRRNIAAKWASLDNLFLRSDMFPDAFGKALQRGGLNVEGATVFGNDLLVGLRSPSRVDRNSEPAAYVISTPLKGVLRQDFDAAKLHILPTGTPFIGIRAMETVGDSVLIITGDAGVNDLKPRKKGDDERSSTININKENPARRFQLRVWKPAKGDRLEPAVVWDFDPVYENDVKGKLARAKVEAIAADPARPGAFFVLYDGSVTVRYLSGVELP